jgi:hypothetical protein
VAIALVPIGLIPIIVEANKTARDMILLTGA